MKKILVLLFINFYTLNSSFSKQNFSFENLTQNDRTFYSPSDLFDLPPLTFENKAACAQSSQKPTRSAFLIVDGYNAGKLLDSFLKGTNDPQFKQMTVDIGLKIFRLSVSETLMTLTKSILNGSLPLLEADPDFVNNHSEYAKAALKCSHVFPCLEMDQYLEKNFTIFKERQAQQNANTLLRIQQPTKNTSPFELDPTLKNSSFFQKRSAPEASCLYIKKFSELQSNWSHDRPDQALLQKIALAATHKENYYEDCFSENNDLSSRRYMLQLDLSEVEEKSWNKYGFDFWYSLKIYFSYAWRHPEWITEPNQYPLIKLFTNLAIEQMIQLFSTGCSSIEKPKCTLSNISLDIYRSLGKALNGPMDIDKPLPLNPQKALLQSTSLEHREESFSLPENDKAEDWIATYQSNIIQKRGALKQKLLLALANFETISNPFNFKLLASQETKNKIQSALDELKSKMLNNDLLTKKIFLLCSEIDMAARPDVNQLEILFKSIPKIKNFKMLVESSSDQQLGSMMDFYKVVSQSTFQFCEKLRVEKRWKNVPKISNSDYSNWYRDLTSTLDISQTTDGTPEKLHPSGLGNVFNINAFTDPLRSSFLSLEKIAPNGQKEKTIICSDASDCIRILLKSMVDLYSVSAWSDSLLPLSDWIQSPSLANPWATETACKMYDPWFQTKQAVVGLISDLSSTILTGSIPIPAYLAVNLKKRDVKSFTLDPKGDDLFLKPNRSGSAVDFTVGIDLGPWTGIPCMAIASPTSNRPTVGNYYSTLGIRFEACGGNNQNRLIVNDNASEGVNQNRTYSGCLMCYLNPYAGANAYAALTAQNIPLVKIIIGSAFSAISFIKKMKDPVNVPKRYKVDLEEVLSTFEKYSFIPENCVKRLTKGKSCQNARLTREERN